MTYWVRLAGLLLSAGLASEIIYYLYKKLGHNPKNQTEKTHDILQEILFFPDKVVACKAYFQSKNGCQLANCSYAHFETGLSKLLKYILDAKHTLDVCVFCICCHELADAVVEAHEKGVVVRVITDDEQMEVSGSQIGKLRSKGIQVRHDHSSFLMHHKFVVIDNHIIITGSLNWTRSGITGNHENVIITNNPGLCVPFQGEFDKLWELYDPTKHLK
ncbi:mitochondrial cardiolipin hydrolase-like [Glandiceps talaboti]